MSRNRRRAVKTRQPKELSLALGITAFWFAFAWFFFAAGGFHGKGSPAYSLVVTVLTVATWWWAIHTIRARNAAGKTLRELRALSPNAFEEWVAARFRDLGHAVKIAGIQGDHGVDLTAEKQGEMAVIQCKKYKTSSVGEPVLRDLYGAMHDFRAARAYLVTTGSLTRSAAEWVVGKPIEVWDGEYLAKLSTRLRPDLRPSPSASDNSALSTVLPSGPITRSNSIIAKCPKCASTLVERRNGRTGETFLGCPKYPACRFTQTLS